VSYSAEISRGHPTCFIFLLDQSRSMGERFGKHQQSKAEYVADVVNRTVHDLVIRCTRTESIRNYYYVSILSYGKSVGSALCGPLAGKTQLPISEIAETPARLEVRTKRISTGENGFTDQQVRFPVWVDAVSAGWTQMCAGLTHVRELLDAWLDEHHQGFPPTVLHLTDGGSTDGDPTAIGRDIRAKSTSDGSVLLFNCHVSAKHTTKSEYPENDSCLPDHRARTLFNISSPLPDPFREMANYLGIRAAVGARGFVFNGDPVSVAQFFEIGTRPALLR